MWNKQIANGLFVLNALLQKNHQNLHLPRLSKINVHLHRSLRSIKLVKLIYACVVSFTYIDCFIHAYIARGCYVRLLHLSFKLAWMGNYIIDKCPSKSWKRCIRPFSGFWLGECSCSCFFFSLFSASHIYVWISCQPIIFNILTTFFATEVAWSLNFAMLSFLWKLLCFWSDGIPKEIHLLLTPLSVYFDLCYVL